MLNDIKDWDPAVMCVPTALSALTGKTPKEVSEVIADGAGEPALADPHRGFSGIHWLPALEKLGLNQQVADDYGGDAYPLRPSIKEFLGRVHADEPQLVYCENADASMTQVFALEGDKLVDTYTGGKVVDADPDAITPEYDAFRVKRTYLVWE